MVTEFDKPTEAISPEQDRALDLALQRALRAPALTGGFRSRLLHAALQENASDLEAQRRALELEHAQARERLRRGYVRMGRNALASVVALTSAAGVVADLSLPLLNSALSVDKALGAVVLGLVIGLCAGASVWRDRFSP